MKRIYTGDKFCLSLQCKFTSRKNTLSHSSVCVCILSVCVKLGVCPGWCARVHRCHVWHTLCGVVFTLVKHSEVNGGHISRWLKKRLAVIIDDAITVWIKRKSVSPLALCLKSHTSCCRLVSPPCSCTLPAPLCNHVITRRVLVRFS